MHKAFTINEDAAQYPEKKTLILFIGCLLLLVSLLSIDLYNPALPSIAKYLNTAQIEIRALLVIYLVSLSLSQVIYSVIYERFSRKKIILVSLILTLLGNYLTTYSKDIFQLYLFRVVTSMGAGGCLIMSKIIIREAFVTERELIRAFAVYVMSAQISPLISPLIGGFLVQYISWQSNFICLAVISGIAAILLFALYKEKYKYIDQLNLKEIIHNYKQVIANKTFVLYSAMSGLIYSLSLTFYTVNPFILQKNGVSPSVNGIYYSIFSLGFIIGTCITNYLIKNFSSIRLLNITNVNLVLVSAVFFISSCYSSSTNLIVIFSVLISILSGMTVPVLMSLNLLSSNKRTSIVSAIQGSIKIIFVSVVLSMLLMIHVNSSRALASLFLLISAGTVPVLSFIKKSNTSNMPIREAI